MTDFDADEPVEPVKRERRSGGVSTDRFLGWSGAALALTAAFFPWYVFFNEDKFGLNMVTSIFTRDMPDWAGRSKVMPSPAAIASSNDVTALPRSDEQVVTGTVPDKAQDDQPADAGDQPFPSEAVEFHVLHAAGGKAMIEDKNGIYVVTPGSMLPDLSRVAKVEEVGGEWVLITDKGEIYDTSGKRAQ